MPAEAALSESMEDALARLSSIPALVAQPVDAQLAKHARHAERYSERLFALGACTVVGFARAQGMLTGMEALAWVVACGAALWFIGAHRHQQHQLRRLETQLVRARQAGVGGPVELLAPKAVLAPPLLQRHVRDDGAEASHGAP